MQSAPIHYAAARGDLEGVARQLKRGAPPDARDGEDRSPLIIAAGDARAGTEMLDLLVGAGADPNAVASMLEKTPLAMAAGSLRPEWVRGLLDAGADAATQSSQGYGAVLTAVYHCTHRQVDAGLQVVRMLLEAGAHPSGVTSYSESALRVASHLGRFDLIKLLLEAGADAGQLGWSPLHHAVALGTLEETVELLRCGADLAARDWWERTPWLLALAVGDVAKAEALLQAGAVLGDRGRCSETNLTCAALNDGARCMAWLIEQGADVRAADEFGGTPLMSAAENGAVACVAVLLARGADLHALNHVSSSAISHAATPDVLRLLVGAGADLNYVDGTGSSVLKDAAEEGDLAVLQAALQLGATVDITSTGDTPLHAATGADQLEPMRLLLDAGADPNARDVDGCTPLMSARSAEAVRLLLVHGADVRICDQTGGTALASQRDPDAIQALLEAGAAVNPPGARGGDAPLTQAARAGATAQVEALLAAGADVGAATHEGLTALMSAAEAGATDCLRVLLRVHAPLEAKDRQGRTALFYASAPEAFPMHAAKEFMRGIDVRAVVRDQFGLEMPELPDGVDTALARQFAADYSYGDAVDAVELLLAAGANVNARDRMGMTPLLLAVSCGSPARVRCLLQRGADARARSRLLKSAGREARKHPDPERREQILRLLKGWTK